MAEAAEAVVQVMVEGVYSGTVHWDCEVVDWNSSKVLGWRIVVVREEVAAAAAGAGAVAETRTIELPEICVSLFFGQMEYSQATCSGSTWLHSIVSLVCCV